MARSTRFTGFTRNSYLLPPLLSHGNECRGEGRGERDREHLVNPVKRVTPHEQDRRPKGWPKTPGVLSGMLRRLAPNLRGIGLGIEFEKEPGSGSRKRIRLRPQKSDATDASDAANSKRVGGVGGVDDLQAGSGDPDARTNDDGTVEGTL